MKSSDIFLMLTIIAEENSKDAKVKLLAEFLEDVEFRQAVVLAYNPHITFGIVDLPEITPGLKEFDAWTWKMLEMLQKRELSGDNGRITIINELSKLNPESALLLRMILDKDLRAGFNVKAINKAFINLIPVFPYMRCSLPKDVDLENFPWGDGVYSQEKADGMFVNITCKNGKVYVNTRTGKRFDNNLIPNLVQNIRDSLDDGYQYHGELLVSRFGRLLERKVSNGVLTSILRDQPKQNYDIVAVLWDYIPVSVISKGKYFKPYSERFGFLDYKLSDKPLSVIPTKMVRSLKEAYDHYDEVLIKGGEGTIVKIRSAIWRDGTSKEQVKIKAQRSIDLRVVGFTKGTGKFEDSFGALMCETEDGIIKVNVSGMDDNTRGFFNDNRFLVLGSIVEVDYNAVIKNAKGDYSLFLPRFNRQRIDKKIADSFEVAL